MATQDHCERADDTDLSKDAREVLLEFGGEKPPAYGGVNHTTDHTDHASHADYRPRDGNGRHHLGEDVKDAFEDAFEEEVPTGFLADCMRFDTGYFHTEWLSIYEAANAVAILPEMPYYEFYPNRIAEQIRGLPANALVAIAREVNERKVLPAIYVWSPNPANTHLFCHASPNSHSLYFDVGDEYPMVGENGVESGEHVLGARRRWSVSRVLFSASE